MQIISKKITVPDQIPKLSRRRLLDQLDQSLITHASTVVCGRAGTGKSLLAAEFAQKCGRRIAWYKVDGSDYDPETFFFYLFAAVRTIWPRFCDRWERIFRISPNDLDMQMLAEHVIGEMEEHQGDPLLIVVDDLHLIYDAPWLTAFFTRLIPLLPRDVHLLICSRSLPPGPLWRVRSKQLLTVIDEGALAFTAEEAGELLGSGGYDDSIAGALKRSRGRAAVLDQLAAGTGYRMAAGALSIRLMA